MTKRHVNRPGDLASLFIRLDELVLANSGADAFDEVFKLVMAQLWDERSGLAPRFVPAATPVQTQRAIHALLAEVARAWPGVLEGSGRSALTADHLQVCVATMARHRLSTWRFEVLDGFFEHLMARNAKGAKGQFFTPRHVVELCVRLLHPTALERVLDPACGSGAFLVQALGHVREAGAGDTALQTFSRCLEGWDIDPRAVRVARALMHLANGHEARLTRRNSLVGDIAGDGTHHGGFDVILTNPPFAGDVLEPAVLARYDLGQGRQRVERDVLFVERCVRLLRPGGRLAMVLPHNKFAAVSAAPMRRWLLERCRVLAVIGLGRNTFLPHTHQKAGVLVACKRPDGARPDSEEAMFFALSERDGKNARGQITVRPDADADLAQWDRIDHDLGDVVDGFHGFCHREGIALGRPWQS